MEALNRIIDDIMEGNGKFTFTSETLDGALSTQLQKVVRAVVNRDRMLPLFIATMYLFLMVKHKICDVRAHFPAIGICSAAFRQNFNAAKDEGYALAVPVFNDKIFARLEFEKNTD
jgi:hypothetical protein